ncbi:cation:proton antiporter [Sphingomonas astaxanthinifaciens]|uniref:Potassium transporter TrkA n=1 Tax=Sphingomonas astaxanthinifaciens DSM 22298 TaxID=1123267 RepID=A0ABQ5Z4G1_9SPHN|nr:cation:proton antiporter [Sphingomonas astaxanthinifaciens]GLR47684.1 potassium transporter TrkA [Sphingomonas astaxanthinifaciens DSM 22298]
MAGELGGQGLSDALVILGAAGVVIPAFARIRISPVIGFILVGAAIGPAGLGLLAQAHPWLDPFTIDDRSRIEPFAEIGILMLLFGIGLELSFRRLWGMRRQVFGLGGAQMLATGLLLGAGLASLGGLSPVSALVLGIALAMSSTAIVMPLAGTSSTTGQTALAILLLQDLSLVPILLLLDAKSGTGALLGVAAGGATMIAGLLLVGRFLLPRLFAQAARTKSPELFLAISLLVLMLASVATGAVGLGAVAGALIAGLLIAETDYHAEVEVITAPLRGLALGIFLITVGMRLDLLALAANWPALLAATLAVLLCKALVVFALLRWRRSRTGTALETGLLMASPSELTLIVLASALAAGVIGAGAAAFWTLVTAIGLTLTPLLAAAGRRVARRFDPQALSSGASVATNMTIIFGFGRVGRIVADMLVEHRRPYLAVDGDIDCVAAAREEQRNVLFGDVARGDVVERFGLSQAAAVVLTMDDPVLTVRLTRDIRAACPAISIIARARDGAHAAQLYKAGATDAVPETMEGSLQMSEALLVDIGVAMGPVIASIHEKRSQLRAQIREAGELVEEPMLGRRR